ncbi:hypothetical protein U0070_026104 [Myodes glareolus]|uniref:DUF4605 domain-containing protein n=2 Tax=Myodes glareolus TaxID=447135 RepID=A0AAW0HXK9_MYOGA
MWSQLQSRRQPAEGALCRTSPLRRALPVRSGGKKRPPVDAEAREPCAQGLQSWGSPEPQLQFAPRGPAPQEVPAPRRMVRILANGEIVQDDDPRVRTTTQQRSSNPRQGFLNRGHGGPPGGPGPRQQQAGARLGAAQSPFNDLNRQLVNMGFPQWHLGNHVVEPVTSILLLFLLMMLGVRGLLLVGLVYLVSHLSQR